jgi:hypothetical protein
MVATAITWLLHRSHPKMDASTLSRMGWTRELLTNGWRYGQVPPQFRNFAKSKFSKTAVSKPGVLKIMQMQPSNRTGPKCELAILNNGARASIARSSS